MLLGIRMEVVIGRLATSFWSAYETVLGTEIG